MNEPEAPMDQLSAHLDRGWDLVRRGNLRGAMLSAQESLEVDADSPEAHNLLGFIYAAEGRAEDALEQYRAAAELDETFVEAMLNAAEVLIHPLGEYQEALEWVDEALEWVQDDDEKIDALLIRVDAMLAAEDMEAARREVRSLPEGPFDNPWLEFQVGRVRFVVGDLEPAEARLERAREALPDHADVHYFLALTYEGRGKKAQALQAFLTSRRLDLAQTPPETTLTEEQFERRVAAAVEALPAPLQQALANTTVLVSDMPGPEVVAEGIDPRVTLMLDDLSRPDEPPTVGRVFVYRRNVERVSAGILELENELRDALAFELGAAFPSAFPTPEGNEPAQS